MEFKKEVIRHGGDRDHDKTFCILPYVYILIIQQGKGN